MGKELWKKIVIDGQETFYSVSSFGQIRNDSTGTILAGSIANNGYRMVHLRYRIEKNCSVHRLVMKAFNPCEDMDYLQVNHIDGNKLNNHISNLEWTTALENMRHSFVTGLQPNALISVYIYDLQGNYITKTDSAAEASALTGDDATCILRCVHEESTKNNKHQYKSYYKPKIPAWDNPRQKEVFIYTDEGDFIKSFQSQQEAAIECGISQGTLSMAIKGNRKVRGLVFSRIPLN